jgi:hypothetical protein
MILDLVALIGRPHGARLTPHDHYRCTGGIESETIHGCPPAERSPNWDLLTE